MGTTYGDRKRATAAIGEALASMGWDLEGYKPDRSESMTDYYDPALWEGVARKGGLLAMVDMGEWHVKKWSNTRDVYGMAAGPCSACGGTGTRQRTCPAHYTRDMAAGSPAVFVPAIPAGSPCEWCGQTGQRVEHRPVRQDPPIPHLRQCAGRWYVIREDTGRVLATGIRPIKAGGYDAEAEAVAVRCAATIDAATLKAAA